MKKVLLIDHYDSFTFNLYQLIGSLGVEVVEWDKCDGWNGCDGIVLSPGPGRPEEYEASRILVQNNYTDIPILGVCLGMQIAGIAFETQVKHANKVMHGKTSQIHHDEKGLFQGIKNPFEAARYHSLVLEAVPDDFEKSAWTEDGVIMGIRHKESPLFGIQFHPESFLTDEGKEIMKNFLKLL